MASHEVCIGEGTLKIFHRGADGAWTGIQKVRGEIRVVVWDPSAGSYGVLGNVGNGKDEMIPLGADLEEVLSALENINPDEEVVSQISTFLNDE